MIVFMQFLLAVQFSSTRRFGKWHSAALRDVDTNCIFHEQSTNRRIPVVKWNACFGDTTWQRTDFKCFIFVINRTAKIMLGTSYLMFHHHTKHFPTYEIHVLSMIVLNNFLSYWLIVYMATEMSLFWTWCMRVCVVKWSCYWCCLDSGKRRRIVSISSSDEEGMINVVSS